MSDNPPATPQPDPIAEETRPADASPLPPAPLEPPEFAQAGPEMPVPPPAQEATRPAGPAALAPTPFGAGRCPRCGGTDFGKGSLFTYGTRFRPAYYKPARLSLFWLHTLLRPFRALIEVEAQACRRCGLLLLQVDTAQLERLERRSGDSR